ncbi:MAG: GxxExxY protein [Alphaproteobacteria bacterium]|nr:GxxExxY protein [Alphaproteobacteria bacterium]
MAEDDVSKKVVDCAFRVHQQLGPGLLENAYEECLCILLRKENIPFQRQLQMPLTFEKQKVDVGYRIDILVQNELIVELKSVEKIIPLHQAQILTYMRLSRIGTGLLINFNSKMFKDGIRRFVL